jgi:molecular chaperone GrpE (heat shock protein)
MSELSIPATESSANELETPLPNIESTDNTVVNETQTPQVIKETPDNEISATPETSENELLQRLNAIADIADINGELLRKLAKDFDVKLKYDAAKQEQIDKLYKENLEYKEGILNEFRRKLILAVIEQIDVTEKCIKSFDDKECSEDNYRELLNIFRDVVNEWQEMLLKQFDVSSYQCEPNSPVDIKRQRILKQIPTDDAALYKHVRQTLRTGYELNGQVLRPELVAVFVKQ